MIEKYTIGDVEATEPKIATIWCSPSCPLKNLGTL